MANSFVFLKDKNLKPENIKKGVKIFKTEGTYEGGASVNNQDKTVNASTSEQTITADQGYTGLGTVTVNAAPLQNRTVDASTVQIDVQRASNDYYGLRHVYVNPVDASIDSNIQAENIKYGVTILGVTGTYSPMFTVMEWTDVEGDYAIYDYLINNGELELEYSDLVNVNGRSTDIYVYSDSSLNVFIDGEDPSDIDYLPNFTCEITEGTNSYNIQLYYEAKELGGNVEFTVTLENSMFTQNLTINYTAGAEDR